MPANNESCISLYSKRRRRIHQRMDCIDVAQINHYFCKTRPEFIKKINRGQADQYAKRKLEEFESHDKNEVDDFLALNYFRY